MKISADVSHTIIDVCIVIVFFTVLNMYISYLNDNNPSTGETITHIRGPDQ